MWYVTDFAISKKTIIIGELGELELGLLRVEGGVGDPREGERVMLLYEGGHVTGDHITRRGGDVTGRRKITSPWMTSRGRWYGKDISDEDIPDAENYIVRNYVAECWNLRPRRGEDVTRGRMRSAVTGRGPPVPVTAIGRGPPPTSTAIIERGLHRALYLLCILIIFLYITILFSHAKCFTYLFILFYLILSYIIILYNYSQCDDTVARWYRAWWRTRNACITLAIGNCVRGCACNYFSTN